MRRAISILLAISALIFASWYGLYVVGAEQNVSAAFGKPMEVRQDIPDSPDEWQGKIDYIELNRQLSEMSARPEMAGLAVAVIEGGKLSFVGTYGVTDKSTQTRVTAKTVFRWASVSKTVTGTFAATLANEGALDLDRPVSSWRTTLRLPNGAESQVTLAQLLAQRTGLTKNAYDEKLEDGESPKTVRAELANAPQQCPPGTCHTYQNIAFDAASEILEQASNRPFAKTVSERYFLPLGMNSATFGMAGLTGAKDWARPHNGSQVRTLKEAYWRVPAAAGVESNIVDFARWLQATMGERPDILPSSVLAIAQEPRVATARLYGGDLRQANSNASYGLGWRSFNYGEHRLVGHSGAVDGYRTTLIFEPAARNGVVAMWNSNWGRPYRIPFAVFDAYDQRTDSRWLNVSDIR